MTCTITITDNGHVTFDPPIGPSNSPAMIQAYRVFTLFSQPELVDFTDIFAEAVLTEKPVPTMQELAHDARRYRLLTGDPPDGERRVQIQRLAERIVAMGKGAVDLEIDRLAQTL